MTLRRLNEMVQCERCHRKFVSYAALSQHFETKHHGADKPPELERKLAGERELDRYKVTVHYTHGPSAILQTPSTLDQVTDGVLGLECRF
jgi:hypothetical protein